MNNVGSGFFGSQFFGSWLHYSPDGTKLFLTDAKAGTPEILDASTHRVVRTLKNGGGVLSPDGRISYQQSSDQNALTRIDLRTGKQLPDIPVPGFHASPGVASRTGEVLTVRKRKPSGNAAYDDAVERAIAKSSPLPQPDDRSVFQRQLELRFRPQDR